MHTDHRDSSTQFEGRPSFRASEASRGIGPSPSTALHVRGSADSSTPGLRPFARNDKGSGLRPFARNDRPERAQLPLSFRASAVRLSFRASAVRLSFRASAASRGIPPVLPRQRSTRKRESRFLDFALRAPLGMTTVRAARFAWNDNGAHLLTGAMCPGQRPAGSFGDPALEARGCVPPRRSGRPSSASPPLRRRRRR